MLAFKVDEDRSNAWHTRDSTLSQRTADYHHSFHMHGTGFGPELLPAEQFNDLAFAVKLPPVNFPGCASSGTAVA